jgi:DNA-binding CsgD family transcriptional regulator
MSGETDYERAQAMTAEGQTQSKIAEVLGVSRQYVHQLLTRDGAPANHGVRHGTVSMAATCACRRCKQLLTKIKAGAAEACKLLRAGRSLVDVTNATGLAVARYVTAARRVDKPPAILAELVRVFDETAEMRPRGRPKGAAAALPSKGMAA